MRTHVDEDGPVLQRIGAKAMRITTAAFLALLVAGAGIGCGDKDEKDKKDKAKASGPKQTSPKPGDAAAAKAAADKAKADKAAADKAKADKTGTNRQAREAAARGNLSHLGYTAVLYMAEHDKPLPSLMVLVKSGAIKAGDLFSPLSSEKPAPGDPVDPGHYVCLPVPMSCPEGLIRLYENPKHYGGGHTIVFFADRHIEKVTKAKLDALIEKTKDWLAK